MSIIKKQTITAPKNFKLIFLGSWNSGKTSIIRRYCANQFLEQDYPIEFFTKEIMVPSAKVALSFKFWDTEDQEKLRPLSDIYYQNADAAIIVFDITSKKSEEEANNHLLELVKRKSVPKILVGIANKSDLISDVDKIKEELRSRWKDKVTAFLVTSAKTGHGIAEAFEKLAVITYKEECYENLKLKKPITALVVGDKRAGKTSVIERFSLRTFTQDKIGLGSKVIAEAKCEGKNYDLQLIDIETGGHTKFNKDIIDGIVLVYDLTLPELFTRLKNLIAIYRKSISNVIPMLLIGNKADLIKGPIYCDNQLMAFLKSEKILHKVVSAKNGFGFASVFEGLIYEVMIKRGSTDIKVATPEPSCNAF